MRVFSKEKFFQDAPDNQDYYNLIFKLFGLDNWIDQCDGQEYIEAYGSGAMTKEYVVGKDGYQWSSSIDWTKEI